MTNSNKPAIISAIGDDCGCCWGWPKGSGPTKAGSYPAIFVFEKEAIILKELSVFIDESGDFGQYKIHSPFYIVTLVFHDQSINITENINQLNNKIHSLGLPEGIK